MIYILAVFIFVGNLMCNEREIITIKEKFLPTGTAGEAQIKIENYDIDLADINKFENVKNKKYFTINDQQIIRSMSKIKVQLIDSPQVTNLLDYYNKAYGSLKNAEAETAIYYYNECLKLADKKITLKKDLLFGRAVASLLLQSHHAAISDLRNALKIDPNDAKSWGNIFIILDKINLDVALITGQSIAEEFPANHLLKSKIGLLYLRKGDKQNAIKFFQDALSISMNAIPKIRISYLLQLANTEEKYGIEKIATDKDLGREIVKESINHYTMLLKEAISEGEVAIIKKKLAKLSSVLEAR